MENLLEPVITWHIRKDETRDYITSEEYFAGTYNGINYLVLYMQIWNNRYGEEDVKDLRNFFINIFFDNVEDSTLLQYCSVIVNEVAEIIPQIIDNVATLSLPSSIFISGKRNDGSLDNQENYLNLKFKFKAPNNTKLKENDIKSLYFEIVER